jgi:thiamine pyrophosphokinase
MRAVIFINGDMNSWPTAFELLPENDLLIAADGGLNHCLRWGITPHVLVGDLDSVDPSDVSALEKKGVEVIRFPENKDETDLQLALQLALDRNIHEIVVLGALGARWDMTLSNVLILASPMLKNSAVTLLAEDQEIFCIHGGQEVEISGSAGDIISLLPLVQDAAGVTLSGFEYPLMEETLSVGSTRGVSNMLQGGSARVRIRKGDLLLVLTRAVRPSQ